MRPGHVAQAALRTGLGPREVQRRLERYGVRVQPFDHPERPDQTYVNWLSQGHDGQWPWVSAVRSASPWLILATQTKLGRSAKDVRAEYARLGFGLSPPPACRESPGDLELLAGHGENDWAPFRTDRAPGFLQLMEVSERASISLRALLSRLAAYRVRTVMALPQRATELDRDLFSRGDLARVGSLLPEREGAHPGGTGSPRTTRSRSSAWS